MVFYLSPKIKGGRCEWVIIWVLHGKLFLMNDYKIKTKSFIFKINTKLFVLINSFRIVFFNTQTKYICPALPDQTASFGTKKRVWKNQSSALLFLPREEMPLV